jgi:two-component system phosphate regulon response regulator PhoB
MSKSILLVHPDERLRQELRYLLSGSGYLIGEAQQLSLADYGRPDLILVAWRALDPPSESLRWIRQKSQPSLLRVIVLADRDEYGAAVHALEYGADDCVTVPVQRDELLIRVNAALRRPQVLAGEDRLTAGPIVLDRSVHRVSVRDKNVELAPTEFRLLAFLLENQGRVFSRNELLTRAWSSNVKAGDRTVDVHVRRLRQQLEPFQCEEMIQTVRGFGYRLRVVDS